MRIDRRFCLPLLLLAGCASAPKEDAPVYRDSDDSSVEIHFVRGHNNHRLFASLKGDSVVAQSFLERQVLAEASVDRTRYLGFLKQATEFLKATRAAASQQTCRTPFTLTVRIGNDTRAASGCMNTDEGALSHLVRDGEFLLHQGSGMRVK